MKNYIRRVLISGLVAGVTILVIGVGLVPIVGDQMDQALTKLSLKPMSSGAMVYFASVSLILGIAIMGAYALIQDKFKAKAKAAILVATLFWFFTYFWSNGALLAYGFLPIKLVVIGTAWGLLELLAATLIGSIIYRRVGK